MYLHLTFEDGSNPYVVYGIKQKIIQEIDKWKCNNYLIVNKITNQTGNKVLGYRAYVIAKQKEVSLF